MGTDISTTSIHSEFSVPSTERVKSMSSIQIENILSSSFKSNPHYVYPAVFLHTLAFTMAFLPLLELITLMLCAVKEGSPGNIEALNEFVDCKTTEIQRNTTHWMMILGITPAIPALFTIPVLGALSDHWGRLPVCRISIIGSIIRLGSYISVSKYHFPLYTLIFSHLFWGFSGSWNSFTMMGPAYIADSADEKSKTKLYRINEAL